MAATDGQIILAASRFGDTPPVYLKDFAKQQLPSIAKIIKGQHQGMGVPTLSNPSLQSTALFLTAGKRYQIVAQPIKIKEGRKPTNVGTKILIPETYPGYFELLSEDGRSTRCIDSVLELSKRRNLRVLARETFRCNHLTRTIHAGEILTTITDNGKFLQCKTAQDDIINLPLEAKAKFSPIAKEDSISGVHSVKNLLLKRMPVIVRLVHGNAPKGLKQPFIPELRLLGCVEIDRIYALPLQKDNDLVSVPLNTKIKLQRAKNMEQLEHFVEFTRFLEKAQQLLSEARDRLQVVDLKLNEKDKKESKTNSSNSLNKAPLIMQASCSDSGYVLRKSASCDSTNSKYNQQSSLISIVDEYDEIDHIYDYVRGLAPLSKGINRFETPSETAIKSQSENNNYCSLMRVASTAGNNNQPATSANNNNSLDTSINSNQQNNINAPNNNNGQQHSVQQTQHVPPHYNHGHIEEDIKPVPPPIETIPGKKIPEKRQRPTLPKLYVRNSLNNLHHTKLVTNNANANGVNSAIAAINGKDSLEPQSPLFHIRYKSLSSLQLTPDSSSTPPMSTTPKGKDKTNHPLTKSASTGGGAREGTLDSSRSGGRTSGDSKLPEKKTRRLSRPRSLSNLMWDLCPSKDKSKKKLYIHQFDHRQQGTLFL